MHALLLQHALSNISFGDGCWPCSSTALLISILRAGVQKHMDSVDGVYACGVPTALLEVSVCTQVLRGTTQTKPAPQGKEKLPSTAPAASGLLPGRSSLSETASRICCTQQPKTAQQLMQQLSTHSVQSVQSVTLSLNPCCGPRLTCSVFCKAWLQLHR